MADTQKQMAELEAQIAEMEEVLWYLESRLSKAKKNVVLQRDVMIKLLQEKPMTHNQVAEAMKITTKNVASLKHQITHNILDENKNPVWEVLVDSVKRMHLMKAGEFKLLTETE